MKDYKNMKKTIAIVDIKAFDLLKLKFYAKLYKLKNFLYKIYK